MIVQDKEKLLWKIYKVSTIDGSDKLPIQKEQNGEPDALTFLFRPILKGSPLTKKKKSKFDGYK